MKQYTVTGMSCAACSSRVEKAVSKVPGVTACSVSLLTNSMGVEGDVPPETVIHAVEDAGYGASLKGQGTAERVGGRGRLKRSGDAGLKTPSDRIAGILSSPYVYVDGTYDVGLAAAALYGWQPCGDGTFAAPFGRNYHGD